MPEKSSVFQSVQLGIESTAGTAVAANKKLLVLSIVPAAKTENEKFRPRGSKYPTTVILNKEWAESKIEGLANYNEILYLLSSLLSMPTPVQQGATTAYKWTFVSNTWGEDAGKTFTVEQGDATTAWRTAGMRVKGLEFTFNRKEAKVSGSALGLPLETGITLTSSPTSLAERPVFPGHLKFYMADSQAGLAGAEAMTRGFGLNWKLMEKLKQAWPVGQNPVITEAEPDLMGMLRLATDAVGMGLLATMRAGATKWFRVLAEGATIESTYKYTIQIDFPAKIGQPKEFSDEDGLYLIEYDLEGLHDATWGKAFQIDVIADTQTL